MPVSKEERWYFPVSTNEVSKYFMRCIFCVTDFSKFMSQLEYNLLQTKLLWVIVNCVKQKCPFFAPDMIYFLISIIVYRMNDIKIKNLNFTYVTKEGRLEWGFGSHAILAHSFNSHGYCTHWQEYRVNFHICGCFCEVCSRKQSNN